MGHQDNTPRAAHERTSWGTRRSPGASDGEGAQREGEAGGEAADPARGPSARRPTLGPSDALLPLESLTTEELQRELERRQGELKRLIGRRERLAHQLAELEAQIVSLGGEPGGAARPGRPARASSSPRPKRTRSKNEITLSDAIAMAVEVRATVTPTEVAQMVQSNGYQSTAKNFAMMVANALAKDKRFRRLSRGQYERIA
jgi:hypothetical protein